jgi:phosphorylase/glycogen(starch) synthase
VDIVTPNGFEDSFVPGEDLFNEKRMAARLKLKSVAEAVLGYALTDDCMFIVNSGRYEFRNKGVDIFIDSLGALNKKDNLKKEYVALIMHPGTEGTNI